jgi:hypothetical protein
VYAGQGDRYYYTSDTIHVEGKTQGFKEGYTEAVVKSGSDSSGKTFSYTEEDGYVYAVATDGEKTEGDFRAPTALLSVDGKLYFGCEDGSLCVFETELEDGYIPNEKYSRNGRRYYTEITTKSDHCGHTNVAKSTVRHSLVIKSKAFPSALSEVWVRTDCTLWHKVDEINAGVTDFNTMDFSRISFNTFDNTIDRVREHEKRWVEKQISIRSECYKTPYGVISISYNYTNAGRIKRR